MIFDLDGVLLDSEQVWDRVRKAFVEESGATWTDEAQAQMMGMSSPEWSAYLRDTLGVHLEPLAIAAAVAGRVLAEYQANLPLLRGAVEAVDRLGALWPLGLASSSNRSVIDAVLAAAPLRGRFTVVVSSEEVARGKPNPDVYLEAVHRLGVGASRCVAVEDSSNGIRAAAAAGLHVVAIPNPSYPPAAEALALAEAVVPGLDALTPHALRDLVGDALGR